MLAQVPDLNDFVAGVKILLRDDGTATFEFPHLLRLLDGLQYDTIYHEHFSYFSLATISEIFRAHGLEVYDVEELWTHGGSLRVYAQHVGRAARGCGLQWTSCSHVRTGAGSARPERYATFAEDVKESKRALLELLIRLRRDGKQVVGYGAPGQREHAAQLLRDPDRSARLHGRSESVQARPLHTGHAHPDPSAREDRGDAPDYVLVLPWNLIDEIAEQLDVRRRVGWAADRPDPSGDDPVVDSGRNHVQNPSDG